MLRSLSVILLLLAARVPTCAQDNIGIRYFGLSIHPKGEKENAFLMPRRLDNDGYLVLNLGAVISWERFLVKDRLSVKVAQALYSDCAAMTGGFSHIGFRGTIFRSGTHALAGGIGPTIVYRKNWQQLDGYKNRNRFRGGPGDTWQYLFLWYGGEFEYRNTISERLDLTTNFIPGYPDLMSLYVGVNYKFR